MRETALPLVVAMLFTLMSAALKAADTGRGETLHNEHCLRCHKVDVYTREERIVNDLAALRERVKQCELMSELLWFDEEVNDVIAYLNGNFYLFGIK